jgi:hypothetical protein
MQGKERSLEDLELLERLRPWFEQKLTSNGSAIVHLPSMRIPISCIPEILKILDTDLDVYQTIREISLVCNKEVQQKDKGVGCDSGNQVCEEGK